MGSGDRNPFDIAHRSEAEVAAEIAARLSAWKQARHGPGAASATAMAQPASAERPSPPDRSAPTRPLPRLDARTSAPQEDAALRSEGAPAQEPRAPSYTRLPDAPISPARRAMPAAPSLRDRSSRPVPPIQRADEPRRAPQGGDFEEFDMLELPAERRITVEAEEPIVPRATASHRTSAGSNHGSMWAIALGTVLLVLGVTLPAALWREPASPLLPQTASQASLAPASPTQDSATAQAQFQTPPVDLDAIAERRMQETIASYATLQAINSAREVAAVPVVAPILEPETSGAFAIASVDATPSPIASNPVARPFESEPFKTLQTGYLKAPPGAVRVKPAIAPRVKPVVASVKLPKKPAAKPVQKTLAKNSPKQDPTLEQMFDDLIRTLSNGQPVNPANQPIPPSVRR